MPPCRQASKVKCNGNPSFTRMRCALCCIVLGDVKFYEEAEEVLSHLKRLGTPMIL